MNLLDFFRKKQKIKKLSGHTTRQETTEANEAPAEKRPDTQNLGESRQASLVLQRPKITEKSSLSSERGVYVFQVRNSSSKKEIKTAVGELYGVVVKNVNVITVPSRKRRVGRKIGHRPAYKKALVKLAEGQKIEFI